MVIAHGVGGSRSDGLAGALVAHRFGFASLVLDSPGHGESDGVGTTFGVREGEALRAAHEWLKARSPGRRIHAIGYSMGGSAVLHAAAEHGIFERIVVDSTFGRLERVAKETRFFVFGPASKLAWTLVRFWAQLLTGHDYSNVAPEEAVARLGGRPLLIVHGARDITVPVSEVAHLAAAARGTAEVFLVEGADHMRTIGHPQYSKRVGNFLSGPPQARATRRSRPVAEETVDEGERAAAHRVPPFGAGLDGEHHRGGVGRLRRGRCLSDPPAALDVAAPDAAAAFRG